jgi:hypothetical protein
MGAAPADDDDANMWRKLSWYCRITRHTVLDSTYLIEVISTVDGEKFHDR